MANKNDLIESVSQSLGCPKTVGTKIVDAVFEELKKMTRKEPVTIKNYGTFEVKEMKGKDYVSPTSGLRRTAPDRHRVKFKASKNYFKEVPDEDSGRGNSKH